MSKDKFLKELEKYLSELDANEINAVLLFYSDYFDKQISSGKTESEIIEELGNPRLLAKSIKENYKNTGYSYNGSVSGQYSSSQREQFKSTTININSWYFKLASAVIGIFVILLIAAVLAGIAVIFLKIVIPVFLILVIISLVKNIFNK